MVTRWIITCEHSSCRVPKGLQFLFPQFFEPHQWYDIGAFEYAERLANGLSAPFFYGKVSRLLVDLNRSLHNRSLFSVQMDEVLKVKLLNTYYFPFRTAVETYVLDSIARGDIVVHISCHTFTPVFHGLYRNIDLGILYDPHAQLESHLAHTMLHRLKQETAMRVRLNAPYRGVSDGHVTYLRRKVLDSRLYVGIELEVNQRFFTPSPSSIWRDAWFGRVLTVISEGI